MILRQCRNFEVQKYHFGAMIYLLSAKLCKMRLRCGTKFRTKFTIEIHLSLTTLKYHIYRCNKWYYDDAYILKSRSMISKQWFTCCYPNYAKWDYGAEQNCISYSCDRGRVLSMVVGFIFECSKCGNIGNINNQLGELKIRSICWWHFYFDAMNSPCFASFRQNLSSAFGFVIVKM